MTLLDPQPPGASAGADGSAADEASTARRRRRGRTVAATVAARPPATTSAARRVASSAVSILALVLLVFVLYAGLLSELHHARAQHNAYSEFRSQLALAVAPVGPTQPEHPNRLLDPGTPVALLTIPEIGLREIVFEGTSGEVLQDGPGHLRNTVLPGQAGVSAIMGRAATYGGPFAELRSLNPGDSFTVTTGQGVSNFVVRGARRAGDPAPPALQTGKGRLQLITADGTPFLPSGVLYVDADLISTTQDTPTPVLNASQLAESERVMATDTAAVFPLFVWGQGLLIAVVVIAWARLRWGRWQVWIVAVPVIGYFGLAVADQVTRLLPNLM